MTLDKAIAHAREKADKNSGCWKRCTSIKDCDKCEQENKQLAEWLEELKDLRELKDIITSNAEVLEKQGYNKAVDDFATKICEILEEYQTGFNMVSMANVWYFSKELAEQLKVGDGE